MDSLLRNLDALPGDVTLVTDTSGSWTAGQLSRAAGGAAHALATLGLAPGDRLAIVVEPSREIVATIVGARAAGLFVCPVDPRDPSPALAAIRPNAVVAAAPVAGFDGVPAERWLSAARLVAAPRRLDPVASPEGLSFGMATSGSSSGKPKIVKLTESSVGFVVDAVQALVRYGRSDRVVCPLPLHHTYGLSQLWLSVVEGAHLILPPAPLLPGDLITWVADATVLPAIAGMMRTIVGGGALPAPRLVTLAGQGTPQPDRQRIKEALPGAELLHFYGMTEASTRILWLPPERFLDPPGGTGVPLAGTEVELTEEGEMVVTGPSVAAGYLDDPDASRERFLDGSRLRTGDLFERVDGGLYRFLGRRDGCFKRFGEKVVPELVEAALDALPEVARSLVFGEPGRQGELEPVAWIVARGSAPAPGQLLRGLRGHLPAAMMPTRFVVVDRLPTTSNNKLLRKRPDVRS